MMEWRGGNHIVPVDFRDDGWSDEDDGDPDYGDEPIDTTCQRCHGDGHDPMSDYLLPCPNCGGEGDAWWL